MSLKHNIFDVMEQGTEILKFLEQGQRFRKLGSSWRVQVPAQTVTAAVVIVDNNPSGS